MSQLPKRDTLEGLEAIHYWLADAVCRQLQQQDNSLLFHAVMACSESLQNGHVCLNLSAIANRTLWQNIKEADSTGYTFPALAELQTALANTLAAYGEQSPVITEDGRLYLRRYWIMEKSLAATIASRMGGECALDTQRAQKMLTTLFPDKKDQSIDWQKVACGNALLSRFALIDGGPGTGKTYTVTRLLCTLIASADTVPTIALAAPTGKAAQRMAESILSSKESLKDTVDSNILDAIPDTASTLHRLLGGSPHSLEFRRNEKRPLEVDVLLIDEVSMVDLPMFTRLFRALPEHTRVILLGDADQLPSVAAGCVVADLAVRPPKYSDRRLEQLSQLGMTLSEDSRATGDAADYTSQLRQVQRFGEDSGIAKLAKATIEGQAKASLELTQSTELDDLAWFDLDELANQIRQWTLEYYSKISKAESPAQALLELAKFRLLTPVRQGPQGVDQLNHDVESVLNTTGHPIYHGRAIMITSNDYEVGLFNGDVGIFWKDDNDLIMAYFDGHEKPFAPGRLPDYESVFAMTIHKTQGSQFDHVALVLPQNISMGLNRKLIYTAVTRAQSKFTAVGLETVWNAAVGNDEVRGSGLRGRLQDWS